MFNNSQPQRQALTASSPARDRQHLWNRREAGNKEGNVGLTALMVPVITKEMKGRGGGYRR